MKGANRIGRVACYAMLVGAVALLAWYATVLRAFAIDDSFIYLRYAEHLAQGQGLVFNPGEEPPSEGLTGPLWAVILTPATALSIDPLNLAKILGLVCLLATCVVLFRLVLSTLLQLASELPQRSVWVTTTAFPLAALAVLLYASDPLVTANAVSGMETQLGVFLLTWFLFRVVCRRPGQATGQGDILTGLVATLACLTRPEFVVAVGVAFAVAWLIHRDGRPHVLRAFGTFCVLGLVYFAWRYSYYEAFWPLPFQIKQGSVTTLPGLIDVGWFLKDRFDYWPYLVVTLLGAILPNPIRAPLRELTCVGVALCAYYLTIAHLMGIGHRFLQPLVPIHLALSIFATALAALTLWHRQRLRWLLVAPLVLFAVIVGKQVQRLDHTYSSLVRGYSDLVMPGIINVGKALHEVDASGRYQVAMTDCGAVPFHSKWQAVDLAGLNSRRIAFGYSAETVLAEVRRARPDVLVLTSSAPGDYTARFHHEALLFEQADELGYELVGQVEIASMYTYWFHCLPFEAKAELCASLAKHERWRPHTPVPAVESP